MKTAITTLLFGVSLIASTQASDASDISKDFYTIAYENGFDV